MVFIFKTTREHLTLGELPSFEHPHMADLLPLLSVDKISEDVNKDFNEWLIEQVAEDAHFILGEV